MRIALGLVILLALCAQADAQNQAPATPQAPVTRPSPPAGSFSWSVTTPQEQRWDGVRSIPISISVGPRPATGVRVIAPQLYDTDLHAVDGRLVLCPTDAPCAGEALTLPANEVQQLWIARLQGDALAAGEYSGKITVVAAEKPEGQGFDAKLHVSSPRLVWVGILLILAGVVLSSFVVQWLRCSADRLALARPAAQLKDQLAALERDVAATEARSKRTFPHLRAALATEAVELKGADRFLQNRWTFWPQPPDNPAEYQAFLTLHSSRIGSLVIILHQGLEQALAEALPSRPAAELEIVDEAIGRVDALAGSDLGSRDEIGGSVRSALKEMADKLAPLLAARNVASDAAPATVNYGSERLTFQLALVNAGGWFIFAVLSSLLGVYVLIAQDPDFGQPKDLLLCFLWGFGLPTAGQGLASMTAPTVAQSLGVILTRG